MKKILLINPWIYDFAAFDLWSKPLGLLYVGAMLRRFGFEIYLIDCLDRHQPGAEGKSKRFGTGKYRRTIVEKPKILSHIPRHWARYGISEERFVEQLYSLPRPDAVLITSIMTYWYPGVKRAVQLVREHLGPVPIILGGIYATLLPDHARKVINLDYIITGPGEIKTLLLLSELFDIPIDRSKLPKNLDEYPFPAFDLYRHHDYMVILTSRGCPFNCSFCAQKLISMPYTRRSVENVLEEFEYHHKKFGVVDFAFYDDALFLHKKKHIIPILRGLLKRGLKLRLHTPNGLFARLVDPQLAELMFAAGVKTVRLSFETANESRRQQMSMKVSNADLVRAIKVLERAGYRRGEIDVYVMMGLPGQPISEVEESIRFVHSLGAKARLASLSPIHGTEEFRRAVRMGLIPPDIDPLLTNNSIFPLARTREEYEKFQQLRNLAKELNAALEI